MKKLLSIALLLFTVSSCDKEKPVAQNSTFKKESVLYTLSPTTRCLPDSLIDVAAQLHNDFTEEILNETVWYFGYNKIDAHADVFSVVSSKYNSEWGYLDSAEFQDLISKSPEDIEASIGSYLNNSEDFLEIYNDIISIIDNVNNDYAEVEAALDGLRTTASLNLAGTDLDAALLMIETSRKSAYFWMPTTRDGSGIGIDLLDDDGLVGMINLGHLCADDGIGASFGFLLIGFLVVPTPVTLGGLALVVGLNAARTSLSYLINNLLD